MYHLRENKIIVLAENLYIKYDVILKEQFRLRTLKEDPDQRSELVNYYDLVFEAVTYLDGTPLPNIITKRLTQGVLDGTDLLLEELALRIKEINIDIPKITKAISSYKQNALDSKETENLRKFFKAVNTYVLKNPDEGLKHDLLKEKLVYNNMRNIIETLESKGSLTL